MSYPTTHTVKRSINRPRRPVDDRSLSEILWEDEKVMLLMGLEPDVSRPVALAPSFETLTAETFEALYGRGSMTRTRRLANTSIGCTSLTRRALSSPDQAKAAGPDSPDCPTPSLEEVTSFGAKRIRARRKAASNKASVKGKGSLKAGLDNGTPDLFG